MKYSFESLKNKINYATTSTTTEQLNINSIDIFFGYNDMMRFTSFKDHHHYTVKCLGELHLEKDIMLTSFFSRTLRKRV